MSNFKCSNFKCTNFQVAMLKAQASHHEHRTSTTFSINFISVSFVENCVSFSSSSFSLNTCTRFKFSVSSCLPLSQLGTIRLKMRLNETNSHCKSLYVCKSSETCNKCGMKTDNKHRTLKTKTKRVDFQQRIFSVSHEETALNLRKCTTKLFI